MLFLLTLLLMNHPKVCREQLYGFDRFSKEVSEVLKPNKKLVNIKYFWIYLDNYTSCHDITLALFNSVSVIELYYIFLFIIIN